jgi:hypothetical protein
MAMVIPPILVFCFYHTPFDAKLQEAISTSCDFSALMQSASGCFTVLFDSLNGKLTRYTETAGKDVAKENKKRSF